ncbi:MAG: SH3 domain-containing protein [Deltaproteobacteria bacterium]|nr:SH3 domain-containing protein [Deltaproteobacteria bacterium]
MNELTTFARTRIVQLIATAGVALAMACGCSANGPVDSEELYGAPDDIGESSAGMTGSVPIGSTLQTTTGVNFRKGPGTSYSVIRVLPSGSQVVTTGQTSSSNSFYKVTHQGSTGWVHGAYLKLISQGGEGGSGGSGGGQVDPPATGARAQAIQRAEAAVGFSYWWGHGRWRPEGPTSSTKGSCSGSCPSCSHSGSYGADCSGMVAKAWEVPSSNDDITVDSHPYSTGNFISSTAQWSIISRGSLKSADALAYNNGSSGHVVLYDSGDGWGSMWVYECKGCSAGCVHNIRTCSSSYKGVRRAGY